MTLVTPLMSSEDARKEFDYAQRHMPKSEDLSSMRVTLEEWDGKQWVIKDKFEHENR
jgi:hypothetical protein